MKNLFGLGILLEVKEKASASLNKLCASLERTERDANQTAQSFNAMGDTLNNSMEGSSSRIRGASEAMEGLGSSVEHTNSDVQRTSQSFSKLCGEVAKTTKAYRNYYNTTSKGSARVYQEIRRMTQEYGNASKSISDMVVTGKKVHDMTSGGKAVQKMMQNVQSDIKKVNLAIVGLNENGTISISADESEKILNSFRGTIDNTANKLTEMYKRGEIGASTYQTSLMGLSQELIKVEQINKRGFRTMEQQISHMRKYGVQTQEMANIMAIQMERQRTSILSANQAMMNMKTTSEKAAKQIGLYGGKLAQTNQPLLRMSSLLQDNAKHWTANAYAQRKTLDQGKSVKEYNDLLMHVNTSLMSWGQVLMGLTVATGVFYTVLFGQAKQMFPWFEKTVGRFVKSFQRFIKPLVEVFATVVAKMMELGIAIMDTMSKFNEAHPIIAKVVSAFLLLVPVLLILLSPLAIVGNLIEGIMLGLTALQPIMAPIVTFFASFASSALLVAGGLAVVGVALVELYKKCDAFRDAVDKAFSKVKEIVSNVLDYLVEKFNMIKEAMMKVGESIWNGLKEIFSIGGEVLGSIMQGVVETLQMVWQGIGEPIVAVVGFLFDTLVNKFVEGLNFIAELTQQGVDKLTQLWDKYGEGVLNAISKAFDFIQGYVQKAIENIQNVVSAMLPHLIDLWNQGLEQLKTIVGNVWNGIVQFWNQYGDQIIQATQNVWNFVKDTIKWACDTVVSIASGVYQAIAEIWTNHGDQIVQAVTIVWQFITQVITDAMNIIKDVVGRLLDAIKGFWDAHGQQITTAVSTVWNFIKDTITSIANSIGPAISGVFDAISSFMQAHGDTIMNIIKVAWNVIKFVVSTTLNAIAGIIEGVLTVIGGIIDFFSGLFSGNFSQMWEGIKSIFTGAVQAIVNLIYVFFVQKVLMAIVGLVEGAIMFIGSLWTSITALFWSGVSWVVSIVSGFVTGVIGFFSSLVSGGLAILEGLWTIISGLFSAGVSWVISIVSGWVSSVVGFFSGLFSSAVSIATSLWASVTSAFSAGISSAISWVGGLVSSVIGFFSSMWQQGVALALSLWTGVSSAFSNLVSSVNQFMAKVPVEVTNFMNQALDFIKGINLFDIGSNMISGLIKGIKSMAGAVVDAMGGVVKGAIDKAKSALGIHSPSRLFKKFGAWTSEGFAIGIGKNARLVYSQMNTLTDNVINTGEKLANNVMTTLDDTTNGLHSGFADTFSAIGEMNLASLGTGLMTDIIGGMKSKSQSMINGFVVPINTALKRIQGVNVANTIQDNINAKANGSLNVEPVNLHPDSDQVFPVDPTDITPDGGGFDPTTILPQVTNNTTNSSEERKTVVNNYNTYEINIDAKGENLNEEKLADKIIKKIEFKQLTDKTFGRTNPKLNFSK